MSSCIGQNLKGTGGDGAWAGIVRDLSSLKGETTQNKRRILISVIVKISGTAAVSAISSGTGLAAPVVSATLMNLLDNICEQIKPDIEETPLITKQIKTALKASSITNETLTILRIKNPQERLLQAFQLCMEKSTEIILDALNETRNVRVMSSRDLPLFRK